jgi:hypothetical protein
LIGQLVSQFFVALCAPPRNLIVSKIWKGQPSPSIDRFGSEGTFDFAHIILIFQILGNIMYENLQFVQSFGKQNVDPLLSELLDNLEPVDDHGAVNVDDLLNGPSTSSLSHSLSSSSISSLASQASSYCSQFSDEQHRASLDCAKLRYNL